MCLHNVSRKYCLPIKKKRLSQNHEQTTTPKSRSGKTETRQNLLTNVSRRQKQRCITNRFHHTWFAPFFRLNYGPSRPILLEYIIPQSTKIVKISLSFPRRIWFCPLNWICANCHVRTKTDVRTRRDTLTCVPPC